MNVLVLPYVLRFLNGAISMYENTTSNNRTGMDVEDSGSGLIQSIGGTKENQNV
jgi:hypothetical protein